MNPVPPVTRTRTDRKSTRLNSSHNLISYAVFCCRTYDVAKKKRNYRKGELSWVLESNTAANAVLKRLGARRSKTYRIYEKPLV